MKNLKFSIIFLFGIIFFSNLVFAVGVTSCGYLNSADTVYVLQNNVTSTTSCLYVNATNITLDLNGYTITYGNQDNDTSFTGVYSNQTYTDIKNGFILMGANAAVAQPRYGVYFSATASNGTIENLNIFNNTYGIILYGADYNIVNNITSNYGSYGIYLYSGSDYNIISNINSNNKSVYGIYLSSSDYNNITNAITIYDGSGIYLYGSDYNLINNITSNYNYNYGIYLYTGSDHNNITNAITNHNSRGIYLYFLLFSTVDYNTLENITSNSNDVYGIAVSGGDYTTIRNVTSNSNGVHGISIWSGSSHCNVTNIVANSNIDSGLYVGDADHSILTDLILNYNTRYGLTAIDGLLNATFINLTANYNIRSGITLQQGVYNSTVTNFTTSNNMIDGVLLIENVYGNVFTNGIVDSNTETGVYLNYSWNNNFTNITSTSNQVNGFYFWNSSTNNVIKNSIIQNNSLYGLYFENFNSWFPQYNTFYNNLINNSANYYNTTSLTNYFNTSSSVSTNIVGGTNSGGNYWGFPNGTGFSDTCADSDKNGVCDSSYSFNGGIDYLPLAKENIPPNVSLPVYTNLTLSNNASVIDLNIYVADTLSSISKCFVNINGTNQTISASGNWCNSSSIYLTGLTEGDHQMLVYANDSANNFALNDSYFIQIDNTIPALEINSPEAITYTTSYILFNVTATDDLGISSCVYSLDDNSNISLTNSEGNYWTRTPSVSDGSHDITFYCTDTSNNVASLSRSFTLDLPEEESSGGGASITQDTSVLSIEKSISIIWDKLFADEEKTSAVSVEGIKLTKISLQPNKNISGASIIVKSISKTLHPNYFSGLTLDNVYQQFQINKTGFTNDDLKYVSFEFKVEKSWLGSKPVSSINLQRKDENSSAWERLNTTLLSSDSTYYYFKATSLGLSLFSIYFDEEVCIPNELFCSGDSLKLCQEDADSLLVEVCEFGCSEGKCLEYWEPDENESVFLRFTRLIFGTWLTFGTLVFSIIVAIIAISLILVSYITFKYFERQRIFRRKI